MSRRSTAIAAVGAPTEAAAPPSGAAATPTTAPITGPAASLGATQVHWFRYYVIRYNATHKKTKFREVDGDTMLGTSVSEAVKAAQAVSSNANVLGVVGPAGSNEVVATTETLINAGLSFITGSATRTSLTVDGTRR